MHNYLMRSNCTPSAIPIFPKQLSKGKAWQGYLQGLESTSFLRANAQVTGSSAVRGVRFIWITGFYFIILKDGAKQFYILVHVLVHMEQPASGCLLETPPSNDRNYKVVKSWVWDITTNWW